MLNYWQPESEYRAFLISVFDTLSDSEKIRWAHLQPARRMLKKLHTDDLLPFMEPFYSSEGRPAEFQPHIIRSLCLMLFQGEYSIDYWVDELRHDPLLAFTVGFPSVDDVPSCSSHLNFINRLWPRSNEEQHLGNNDLLPKGFHKTHEGPKPKKGEKLEEDNKKITDILADWALHGNSTANPLYRNYQQFFNILGLKPSIAAGLIDPNQIDLSGDGSAFHEHANGNGHRKVEDPEEGAPPGFCSHRYSDPFGGYGWDSDLNTYYFGYSLYTLSTHNAEFGIDLPLSISLFNARRHDSVLALIMLKEFRQLHPDFTIHNLCLDSAHDNYPTYNLCRDWNIIPFIDLNTNRGRPKSIPDNITIDTDGTPLCQAGERMVFNGNDYSRNRAKWRCPLAASGKPTSVCPCIGQCSSSPYGRCVYTHPDWDIRLYPPVPRGTDAYKKAYNERTCCERINNRILNDFHLHNCRSRTSKRLGFLSILAGVLIHIAAQIKVERLKGIEDEAA